MAPVQSDLSTAAIVILSSDLLPGWYDDWVLIEAEDWRQIRLHALETLASRLTAAECWGQAADAARAAVRAEPLRESAHAALIQVHLAEGNQSEAMRQFTRYRTLLHAELGLEPTLDSDGLSRVFRARAGDAVVMVGPAQSARDKILHRTIPHTGLDRARVIVTAPSADSPHH